MLPSTLVEPIKRCPTCRRNLPFSAFALRKSTKDGLRAQCRQCQNKQRKKVRFEKRGTLEATLQRMLDSAKHRAKKLNIPCDLTIEYLYSLVTSHCPITLAPIDWIKAETPIGCPGPNSPSLDKIVPELGYTQGNCSIISHRGNTIKSNGTIDEHRRVIKYMAEQQLKHIDF